MRIFDGIIPANKRVSDALSEATGVVDFSYLKGRDAYLAARRYLRWHRARPPGAAKNKKVGEIKKAGLSPLIYYCWRAIF